MATTKKTPSTPLPKPVDTSKFCDPCQVKERGQTSICGFQGKSLAPHLKKHGPNWNTKTYAKKFPKFSLGEPSFRPSPEHIKRLQEANPNFLPKAPPPTEEEKLAKTSAEDAKLNDRIEELWDLCERDPAARMICFAAAKDEIMLKDAYHDLDELLSTSRPDSDKLKGVNAHIADTSKRLDTNLKSLNLTVKQRRESNQLGTDSVSQIIGGYANTRRKMSLEKQDSFDRRIATVMSDMQARVRMQIIDQVDDSFDQATEAIVDDSDFRAAILSFNQDKNR